MEARRRYTKSEFCAVSKMQHFLNFTYIFVLFSMNSVISQKMIVNLFLTVGWLKSGLMITRNMYTLNLGRFYINIMF
jgi:hypothetical protein